MNVSWGCYWIFTVFIKAVVNISVHKVFCISSNFFRTNIQKWDYWAQGLVVWRFMIYVHGTLSRMATIIFTSTRSFSELQLYHMLSSNTYANFKRALYSITEKRIIIKVKIEGLCEFDLKCWRALVFISLIKYEIEDLLMCLLSIYLYFFSDLLVHIFSHCINWRCSLLWIFHILGSFILFVLCANSFEICFLLNFILNLDVSIAIKTWSKTFRI